jgi:hypothetical protein
MKIVLSMLLVLLLSGCFGQAVKPNKSRQFVSAAISHCEAPQRYRKSLLMIDWQQASQPDATPHPQITKRYIEELRAELSPENLQIYTDYNAKLIGYDRADIDMPSMADQIVNLARKAHVQYVLHGRMLVDDRELSTLAEVADYLDFRLMGSRARAIEMELSLYDGISGSRVANGTFALNTDVARLHQRNLYDTHSLSLKEALGDDIALLLKSQAAFVQGTMKCLPLQAQVLRRFRDTMIVDVGSYHGVQVGDRFKIARRQDWGKYRQLDTGIQFTEYNMVEITQVGVDTSQARVIDDTVQEVTEDDLIVSSH